MRWRRVPLAWKNLTHRWRRLAVALSGIGFAVVLMFMEIGFKNALFDSPIKIIQELDADIFLINAAKYAITVELPFSQQRIYQARQCPGVAGCYPLYIETFYAKWKPFGRKGHPIRVLAYELGDPVFLTAEVIESGEALREPQTALVDTHSKAKFMIPDSREELLKQRGAELCDRAIRLVGTFQLGTDFAIEGNLIMSQTNFASYFPQRTAGGDPLSVVDLGIVQVAPNADIRVVQRKLRQMLPDDVAVFTKQEVIDREINFWKRSTPIGYIFLVGTIMGFVVGVIICYQTLYSDVTDHLAEFATLKAMGYGKRYFIALVLMESLYLSVLSFLPGLLVSLALYHVLAWYTGLLMILNFERAAVVFLLTAAMCVASGCMAMRKVLTADPAELF